MTALAEMFVKDPDNDLSTIVAAFKASGEACWHVDRHVLEVSEAKEWDSIDRAPTFLAALALARKWVEQRMELGSPGILVSMPRVIIDDEWINGANDAQPPHVYICLSESDKFAPVRYADAVRRVKSGSPSLDAILMGQEKLLRVESSDAEGMGAWIVEFSEP